MKRAIDLRGAIAINVITMIGIGPLVTIPLVIAALGGPLALVGWIAGAIVALCDGLVWAELSSRFPGSGGTYVYLRNVFGAAALGTRARLSLQLAVLVLRAVPAGQRLHRLRQLCRLSLSAARANAARTMSRPSASACVTMLLLYRRTSSVACVGRGAGRCRDADGRAGCVGRALACRLRSRISPAAAGALRMSASSRGSAPRSTSRSTITWATPTPRCSATKSSARSARFRSRSALGADRRGALHAASSRRARRRSVAIAARRARSADRAGAVRRRVRRRTDVGTRCGRRPSRCSCCYRLRLALRKSARAFRASRLRPRATARFFPSSRKLHPRKEIPHVALLAVGGLSLVASLFTLDQVIAFLTAGIVLIQGIAQIVALVGSARARRRGAVSDAALSACPH